MLLLKYSCSNLYCPSPRAVLQGRIFAGQCVPSAPPVQEWPGRAARGLPCAERAFLSRRLQRAIRSTKISTERTAAFSPQNHRIAPESAPTALLNRLRPCGSRKRAGPQTPRGSEATCVQTSSVRCITFPFLVPESVETHCPAASSGRRGFVPAKRGPYRSNRFLITESVRVAWPSRSWQTASTLILAS